MTITKTFINRLIKAINNSFELSTCRDATIMTECDDFCIRYEDLNGYKISVYFNSKDDECIVGYFDHEEKYHWFGTYKELSEITESMFLMNLAIRLYRVSEHAENADNI